MCEVCSLVKITIQTLLAGFLFISLVISLSHGAIKRFDVTDKRLQYFTLKDVCGVLGTAATSMIDITSITRLNCTGKTVNVNDFCSSKYGSNKSFMRGFIDIKEKKAYCQFARGVQFAYNCKNEDKIYCGRPAREACKIVRQKVARNLILGEYSISDGLLNCEFISRSDKKLTDIPASIF